MHGFVHFPQARMIFVNAVTKALYYSMCDFFISKYIELFSKDI